MRTLLVFSVDTDVGDVETELIGLWHGRQERSCVKERHLCRCIEPLLRYLPAILNKHSVSLICRCV